MAFIPFCVTESMQQSESDALKSEVDKILESSTVHSQLTARRLQELSGQSSPGPTPTTATTSLPIMGLSADQQLLLALQRGNLEADSRLRMPASAASVDREALFSLAAQNQGLSARSGMEGNAGLSDGILLQLLGERQRQQLSFDSVQQHLQRQAFARELAEREYERNLAQRLGIAGAGFGGSPFGSALDSQQLLQSQAALLGHSRLASLLGGQLPPSLLQGAAGLSAATAGGLLNAPGLAQAAPGQPLQNIRPFDHTITLEARSKHAFPVKLYRMIERAERNGQDDIISFIDDGKAFAIHKPRAFETDIMPSYFNSHRMSSFQRQLNIYVSTHNRHRTPFLALLYVGLSLTTLNYRVLSGSTMASRRAPTVTSISSRTRKTFWRKSSVLRSCAKEEM
jgi:hypothetical protein